MCFHIISSVNKSRIPIQKSPYFMMYNMYNGNDVNAALLVRLCFVTHIGATISSPRGGDCSYCSGLYSGSLLTPGHVPSFGVPRI